MLEWEEELSYAFVVLATNKRVISFALLVLLVLTWRVGNEGLFSA